MEINDFPVSSSNGVTVRINKLFFLLFVSVVFFFSCKNSSSTSISLSEEEKEIEEAYNTWQDNSVNSGDACVEINSVGAEARLKWEKLMFKKIDNIVDPDEVYDIWKDNRLSVGDVFGTEINDVGVRAYQKWEKLMFTKISKMTDLKKIRKIWKTNLLNKVGDKAKERYYEVDIMN